MSQLIDVNESTFDELKRMLITCDGKGKINKENALKEIIDRVSIVHVKQSLTNEVI
jgi:hypothetical protein